MHKQHPKSNTLPTRFYFFFFFQNLSVPLSFPDFWPWWTLMNCHGLRLFFSQNEREREREGWKKKSKKENIHLKIFVKFKEGGREREIERWSICDINCLHHPPESLDCVHICIFLSPSLSLPPSLGKILLSPPYCVLDILRLSFVF